MKRPCQLPSYLVLASLNRTMRLTTGEAAIALLLRSRRVHDNLDRVRQFAQYDARVVADSSPETSQDKHPNLLTALLQTNRGRGNPWPTIVIEAANSESLRHAQEKVDFHLAPNRSEDLIILHLGHWNGRVDANGQPANTIVVAEAYRFEIDIYLLRQEESRFHLAPHRIVGKQADPIQQNIRLADLVNVSSQETDFLKSFLLYFGALTFTDQPSLLRLPNTVVTKTIIERVLQLCNIRTSLDAFRNAVNELITKDNRPPGCL
ncbi:hypothetical protein BC937DRAFT_90086 [Endogone sp. FLAS-F59071]|nr:hypothetical protein BC937DRAFT_90086 [Endogone sp. FLAS-F59071]|eukprot:RUS17351.1 hypothetical protein BC937DRAFT_90086 [Endogone sp. FLAS-F59071]